MKSFVMLFIFLTMSLSAEHVAVCIPAVDASDESVQSLIESGRRHFCRLHDVQYFILSDTPSSIEGDDVEWLSAGISKPFKLFSAVQANKSILDDYNYIFIIDPKMLFVASVGNEVFGELIGVQNVNSTVKKPVFSSRFFGGKPKAVMDLLKLSYKNMDINQCFKEKPPTRILNTSYAYPENWELEYSKKIVERIVEKKG